LYTLHSFADDADGEARGRRRGNHLI